MALVLASVFIVNLSGAEPSRSWETIDTKGTPTARHEAALVGYDNRLYLLGGRRVNPVDEFDPAIGRWTTKSRTPLELHHFQGVVVGDEIFLMGAMTGPYPGETPLEKVVVYLPQEDRFEFRHGIPETRRRGGAGATYYKGKIYLVGGITNGHIDGCQSWFDAYDPKTGQWTVLPDAPHARDHFQAVVINDRLYAAGGRRTSKATGEVFSLTEEAIDIFDFSTGEWLPESECPRLPTPRAGTSSIAVDGKLVIGGGESAGSKTAHSEIEVYDPVAGTWGRWADLNRGRHGSGLVQIGNAIYTASGSGNRGGSPELDSTEKLNLVAKLGGEGYRPLKPITNRAGEPKDFTIVDKDRDREIPVRVYDTEGSDAVPVILFSHGLGGSRAACRYGAEHWAARGYIVVVMQHEGSDESVWKGQPLRGRMAKMKAAVSFANTRDRFLDVKAVLDELARWNEDGEHDFHQRLDLEHVGMSGHSYGAVTTQGVSGQAAGRLGTPYTDPRIDAAIMMSPSRPARLDPQVAFGRVTIPWMMMTGTKDTSSISDTTVEDRRSVYPGLPASIHKYEIVLDEALHSAFSDARQRIGRSRQNPNHHRVILALSTAFWDGHLKGQADALRWLHGEGPQTVIESSDLWQFNVPGGGASGK